jgi:hypothetical protein
MIPLTTPALDELLPTEDLLNAYKKSSAGLEAKRRVFEDAA